MNKHYKTSKFIFFLLAIVFIGVQIAQAATLSGGEYTVQVAIDPAMSEDTSFITTIKTMMKDASAYLHTATKEQAIFGTVIILVPDSWADDPSYEAIGTESVASADIFAGKNIGGAYATPGKIFIDDQSMDGDTVVHEWGHYRWGLGDEYCDYVRKDDGTGTMRWYQVYKTSTGWNRCTALQNIVRDCEERLQSGAACSTTTNEVNGAKASIMHRQWNPGIDSFCDNVTDTKYKHNSTVNNHQNRIHARKSCWEVISAHSDGFKSSNGTTITYKEPVFVVKKAGKAEVMLVLDVSGSMSGSPILNSAAAARSFVDRAEEGSYIGVISFSTSSSVLLSLTEVTASSRATIKAAIPTSVTGSTCIGCGLQSALGEFSSSTRSMPQMIALLTDGGENVSPYVADVMPSVIAAGVKINSIGLGAAADPQLQDIADQTGGSYYFAPQGNQQALSDAFITIANQSNSTTSATVESVSTTLDGSGGTATVAVDIDASVGSNTVFTVSFSDIDLANAQVSLTKPDSTLLDDTYTGYSADTDTKTITYAIDGNAAVGTWTVGITNNDTSETTANLQVTSAGSSGTAPITLTAKLDASEVTFPAAAVIRASLFSTNSIIMANVEAEVTNPDDTVTTVTLNDNGQGADSFPQDGNYAAYYTGYTGSGNYTVQVYADNANNTAQVGSQFNDNTGYQSDTVMAIDGNQLSQLPLKQLVGREMSNPQATLSTNFQRATSAGGFKLTSWMTGDQVPPDKITTLSVVDTDTTSMVLTWVSVGDDLGSGSASSYDLRYSTSDITDDTDFDNASQVTGVMTPRVAGTDETYTVTGLTENTRYYFAIKTTDDAGNTSDLSNVYSETTTASTDTGGGGGDSGGGGCFISTLSGE